MHALGHLIAEARITDPSLSYARIAHLAGVTTSAVGKWANPRYNSLDKLPLPKSINGLAAAIQRPPLQVLLAAAQAAGIDVSDPTEGEFAHRLPPAIGQLPDDVAEALLRLLWAVASSNQIR